MSRFEEKDPIPHLPLKDRGDEAGPPSPGWLSAPQVLVCTGRHCTRTQKPGPDPEPRFLCLLSLLEPKDPAPGLPDAARCWVGQGARALLPASPASTVTGPSAHSRQAGPAQTHVSDPRPRPDASGFTRVLLVCNSEIQTREARSDCRRKKSSTSNPPGPGKRRSYYYYSYYYYYFTFFFSLRSHSSRLTKASPSPCHQRHSVLSRRAAEAED